MIDEPAEAEPGPATLTEPRRLRALELALVTLTSFLPAILFSLEIWWTGDAPTAETAFVSLERILYAVLSLSLLVYVLRRQGRNLRAIGVTFQRADILWVLPLLFFSRVLWGEAAGVISQLELSTIPPPAMDPSWIAWLAVLPSAACEELIVRAFLMTEVAALTGTMALAVVASVGYQTLYHLYQGTAPALASAGMFFVFAVFYASTRRITPVVLAHALLNFWSMAAR